MQPLRFRNEILYRRSLIAASLLFVASIGLWLPLKRIRNLATDSRLRATFTAIGSFAQKEGVLPEKIGDLRVYFPTLPLRDSFGNLMFYTKLSDLSYVLRSYGPDQRWYEFTTPHEPRPIFVNPRSEKVFWANGAEHLISHYHPIYRRAAKLNHSEKLAASVQTISNNEKTRLLITRNSKNRHYVLHSRHEAVEEFEWVLGQNQIIFTAGDDGTRSTGIYLWDIEANTEERLFPSSRSIAATGADDTSFPPLEFLGCKKGAANYFFKVHRKPPKTATDSELPEIIRVKLDNKGPSLDYIKLDFRKRPYSEVAGTSNILAADGSVTMFGLPAIQPPWLNAIDAWQQFSANAENPALAKAGTWVTLNLYVCALTKFWGETRKTPIRAFASELAAAIANAPGVPRYQKIYGYYAKSNLISNFASKRLICPY